MHNYEAQIFAAELGTCVEIDLHEEYPDNAIIRLEHFIHQELMRHTEVIRIIHGRGSGKLEQAVKKFLKNQKKLVPYFRPSERLHEAGAITYACLATIKKAR